jgi:hypothetical protein
VPYGVHAATIGTNSGYTIEKFSVNWWCSGWWVALMPRWQSWRRWMRSW